MTIGPFNPILEDTIPGKSYHVGPKSGITDIWSLFHHIILKTPIWYENQLSLYNNWLCKKYLSSYLQIRFKKGSREVTKILSRDQNENHENGPKMTNYWVSSCLLVMCTIRKDFLCKNELVKWKFIKIQASDEISECREWVISPELTWNALEQPGRY